jgi:predicted kinase
MTFDDYLDHFKTTNLWAAMQRTVEASPWHREANVAAHTEMCLAAYEALQRAGPYRSCRQKLLVRTALLFHDVGKPVAEETLEKKDGSGTYRRYAGHEPLSANYFMQQYVTDEKLRAVLQDLGGEYAARQVKWLIEHHLPFSFKDSRKRELLRLATLKALNGDDDIFFDHLRSDCAGRISDDHETKKQAVEDWIASFKTIKPQFIHRYGDGLKAFMMIGPSGSGKTTWCVERLNELGHEGVHLNLDDLRLEYVFGSQVPTADPHGAYAKAWKISTEQEGMFKQFVQSVIKTRLERAVKNKLPVFVDNAYGSTRGRAMWVEALRHRGFHITAVEFWNSLDTVLQRQLARPEKQVPTKSVIQQWEHMSCAWLGSEADTVEIVLPQS